MDKLKMHSPDMSQENILKIRTLFPNCVSEGRNSDGSNKLLIDFEQLKQELSDSIIEGSEERYQLNWPGKREAILRANAPIAKTLRPNLAESVDFETTKNIFIEGDNLEALKLLQETYLGKVKLIYIDPPYNTGNDFIYEDNFIETAEEYFTRSLQQDDIGNKLVSNPETNGRFHSDWLTMIYPRLKLARNLLADNGLIFISIGDDEQASLKKVCDEIFGSENFLGCACRVSKKANNQGDFWSPNYDYILTYAKNKEFCDVFFGGVNLSAYKNVDEEGERKGELYQLVRLYMTSLDSMRGCSNQRYYIEAPDGTLLIPPGNTFPELKLDGEGVAPQTGEDKVWRWSKDTYLKNKDKIVVRRVRSSNLVDSDGNSVLWNVFTKTYLNDVIENSSAKPNSLIEDHINQNSSHELKKLGIPFSFAKPSSLIKYLCEISRVKSEDIVLDFFAGSGSTAHGVIDFNEEFNSAVRFILVQLPEQLNYDDKNQKDGYIFCEKNGFPTVIPSITKERIRRVAQSKQSAGKNQNLDMGFRVLNVDTSNMADVFYSANQLSQQSLQLFTENIKADRSSIDLLFQVLLDWGVDLTLPITTRTIGGKEVFCVNETTLVACFAPNITETVIHEIAVLEPLRVVFRDDAFASDSVKINVEQIFRQLAPHTEIKTI